VAGASPAAAGATPISGAGTPVANATPVSGAATPVGSPAASPVASETPTVGAATPNPEEAQSTVTATYKSFKDVSLKTAHMSESDFRRLIVKPAIAREKVKAALDDQIGQSGEQEHVAHILVDTKDLAESIYQQLQQPGANFEQIAKDQSEDSTTAPNGGDLGWVAKGEMVPEFEQVAFATAPGQISQPFQTKYGWHIVKVYEKDPNRPMTAAQLTAVQAQALTTWVAQQKASMKITSEAVPTATPATTTFSPPADAPPTPTATVEAASPVAGEASPVASPVASPAASPAA
jgi:PPIC-type peptidyl-prolyl cis-trans isomerase-like protein